MRDTYL